MGERRATRSDAPASLHRGARVLVVSCVFFGAGLLLSVPTSAAARRGHAFSFAFGGSGSAPGELSAPSGVAVSDPTGDVYVADEKNERVDQFRPVFKEGRLVEEQFQRSLTASRPRGVAVDNSMEAADPSAGDVYVVAGGKVLEKFAAEGQPLGEIRSFDLDGRRDHFSPIEGVAVGAGGWLEVYQKSGVLDVFNNAVANVAQSSMQLEPGGLAARGFALDSEDNAYVGVRHEGGPVVARLEGITGKILVPQLDAEETTAVAVNTTDDEAATGVDELNDVYVDNVTGSGRSAVTTVAEFAVKQGAGAQEEPEIVQRFGAPGLKRGDGVAVDARTGTVYVADSASDEIDVFELVLPGPPTIEDLSASAAVAPAAGSRTLTAQVNPSGAETHYHFEYGSEACVAVPSTCVSAPVPAGDLGGGTTDREASIELRGLPPGLYHFRLVAENSVGEAQSAEETFTIVEVVNGLPDHRAWEMVSPSNKHGAAIEALTHEGGTILAAEDGDAITYVANGAITEQAEGNRSFEPQQVLSTRNASGWSTQDIATPEDRALGVNGGDPEYRFFSSDLSLALVEPYGTEPPLAPGVSQEAMYLRADEPLEPQGEAEALLYGQAREDGARMQPPNVGYLPVLSEASAPEAPAGATATFLGATEDLEDVIMRSGEALTGPSSGPGLYEWSGDELRFVSELPEEEGKTGKPAGGSVALGYYEVQAHAISADGARVIWTASEESPAHLYMRDFSDNRAQTIQLDKAEGVTEPGTGSAKFQTASSNGSRVFFTDKEVLARSASAEPVTGEEDLYECEIIEAGDQLACDLRDLTIPLGTHEHAAVQGALLGSSEDGSTVYLVAHGVLASNQNERHETAVAGDDNLYELHYDGRQWTTTFIAVLSGEDSPDWDAGDTVTPQENTAFLTARVSPNGEYLAFMSQRSLTGYDNEDQSSERPGERLDQEVYLYRSSTHNLTCASCNPTGTQPVGVLDEKDSGEGLGLVADRREIWRGQWLAASIPGWTPQSLTSALIQSRYLSNEGRLFFNSADALVPGLAQPTREEEVDGHRQRVGVENVYEYEPNGVGSCQSTQGCIALISAGTSENESAFLEATPSGDDVFVLTAARLLPQDTDTAFDIYDARACSSDTPCAAAPESTPSQCVTAEECRPGLASTQAAMTASGSATLSGAGNLAPPPLANNEVKSDKASTKPLTRAQNLAKALEACRKTYRHSKKRLKACEADVGKRYRARKSSKSRANRSATGK